jgi:hypothetical protein
MHHDKVQLLEKNGLYRPVVAAAAKHRVSADEVVHAAHGRPTSANAKAALAAFNPDDRNKLKAMSWPYDCPSCGLLTDRIIECGCPMKGCPVCLPSTPCGGCRQMEKEREEQLKMKEARQREIAAKRSPSPNR